MTYLLKWWVLYTLLLIGIGVFVYSGFWTVVLARDITYLSFVIIAITLVSSTALGIQAYTAIKNNEKVNTESYWFIADNNLALGLIGTLVGFIHLFSQIDPTGLSLANTVAMQGLVTLLITGLGTKLFTTLFGLIGERFLKYQLMVWEKYNETKEKL